MIDGFEIVFNFLVHQGYFIYFILIILEGPVVSYAASFASSLGYFDIRIIFILTLLGNFIADMSLYSIGRVIRGPTFERIVARFGLTKNRLCWLEKSLHKHPIKTILITKFVPPLPIPGIITFGFLKFPLKKLIITGLLSDFVFYTTIVTLGYYSGLFVGGTFALFKLTQFIIPIGIVLIFALYLILRLIYKKTSKNIKTC